MSHAGCHWICRCLFLLCALMTGAAMAQQEARRFEHIRTGFPLTGMHANERCESCHVNGVFKGTPRDCASCHVAGSHLARGNVVMPRNHVPTRDSCDSCHGSRNFSGARFSHAGVRSGSCATCHNGATATGKPGGHVQTTASCDSCHRSGGWQPAAFDHAGVVPGSCATCHNGTRATGKPATPIHNGIGSCDACHASTRTWAGARVDHATFTAATHCASCHNGSSATGKPASHIPVGSANCASCHRVTGWAPSTWNHTQVTVANQCAGCHSGGFPPAGGRPANHIPYASLAGVAITNCDTCHKAGYTAWATARLHASVSVSTQCATCHTGSYADVVGKPANATHASVTACESCHRSTSSWSSVSFAHSAANAVGTGTCDSCHNGSAATGKPASHIPVATGASKCDSCHRSQSSFGTSVTMDHNVVTATSCKTCHNGAYVSQGATGALGKPANHIPESTQLLNGAAMDCNACHRSTASWGSMTMNHNGSQGGGAGWCKSCHLRGTTYLGGMERMTMTHRSKTPPAVDCSESGCHRPLGSKGATYSKWD